MNRVKERSRRIIRNVQYHALSTRKRLLISAGGVLLVAILTAQFLYSTESLLPFSKIDSVAVGGMNKSEAVKKLDAAYAKVKVPVYFSSDSEVKVSPVYADLGVEVSNKERVAAHDYPWYMRLVPSSVFWYGFIDQSGEPTVTRDDEQFDTYFTTYFGVDCTLDPVNAGLAVADGELEVIPAVSGGECDYDELHPKLKEVPVKLDDQKIVVEGTTEYPEVSDETAEKEKARVKALIAAGVTVQAEGKKETIPEDVLYEWLQYTVKDDELTPELHGQKSSAWLTEKFGKQFAVSPGVTTVVTRDFTELSRSTGKSGQALDVGVTRQSLEAQLRGEVEISPVAVRVVPPTVRYERSYSPTDKGLSALLKNFSEENPGTYGLSLVEFGGKKRRAEHNAGKQFTAASTYKLFVAYSALLRVEDGRWRLSDKVHGGRDVAKCIEDSLALSDNPCAEVMLRRIGFTAITNEAKAIGARDTSFLGSDGIKTSARDQAVFMGALHSGQLLSKQSSRDRLLGALKRNIHRQGVPAGVPGMTVANKVGFLEKWLHDTSLVYSPSGTYVLVVMTEGSSWGKIAELTKQIEKLRSS